MGSSMEKSSRIFVAVHRGLVGSAIMRRLRADGHTNLITRTREELDLLDAAAVNRFFGVERPETRLKLWLLEAQLMTEWAESLGAGFLAPPAAASDEDGFLGENYYSDDVTHANAAYGALVLDQVAAILERSSKQVSHG